MNDNFVNNNSNNYILPEDFDVDTYKLYNKDIRHLSDHDAIKHYISYGRTENRIYKCDLPEDFDVDAYKIYNDDIRNMSNQDAIKHYINYGKKENRIYKINLPEDFDIDGYRYNNDDLKKMDRMSLIKHYISYGKKEKRKYSLPKISIDIDKYKRCLDINLKNIDIIANKIDFSNIKINDDFVIILGHSSGGGLSKYIYDVTKHKNYMENLKNRVVVTNEISCADNDVLYINNESIIDFILKSKNSKNKVILHINIFPYYKTYDINKIKALYDSFFEKNIQVIITVHDYYYLNQQNPTMTIKEFDDMVLKKSHIDTINYIFSNVHQVIFPTNKSLEKYIEKGIVRGKNFIVIDHIDINYKDIMEYYNRIENEYKILFLGDKSEHKGYHIVDYLSNNVKICEGKIVKYYYLGNIGKISHPENVINIGEYEYNNILKIINNIKPHLCLCLSSFYETYSYATSVILKTGLPIFYNEDVYNERLQGRKNTYGYKKNENLTEVSKKFMDCLIDIAKKESSDYKIINEKMDLCINDFYKNEYCKNVSFMSLEKEIIQDILKNKHNNNTEITNLVIVTSKIITSSKMLSYVSKRSIFTPHERLEQTIKTIKSIRKRIPKAYIILLDNSDFSNHNDIIKELSIVDKFLNPSDLQNLTYNTNSIYKQIGEASQTKYILEYIKQNNIKFKNLFKITGRYVLNNNFRFKSYNNDHNIFRKNENVKDREYYYTCFYKIAHTSFDKYIGAINNVLNNGMNDDEISKMDYEVLFPRYLNNNFKLASELGVTQNISVWDDTSNI